MINLRNEMKKIVEKYVKYYKEDIEIDFQDILNKHQEDNVFYWYIRKCGTDLFSQNKIIVKDSFANVGAMYFSGEVIKVYKIEVSLKKTKNFYGKIQQIEIYDLLNKIKKETIEAKEVKHTIIFKDGKKNNVESFKNIIYKKNINIEDIEKHYIDYIL